MAPPLGAEAKPGAASACKDNTKSAAADTAMELS
jgi:hypothetical protein